MSVWGHFFRFWLKSGSPAVDFCSLWVVAFSIFFATLSESDFLMHLGRPLAHFWLLVALFGLPLGWFWLPLGSLLVPFGSRWLTFGSLLAPFGFTFGHFGSIFDFCAPILYVSIKNLRRAQRKPKWLAVMHFWNIESNQHRRSVQKLPKKGQGFDQRHKLIKF